MKIGAVTKIASGEYLVIMKDGRQILYNSKKALKKMEELEKLHIYEATGKIKVGKQSSKIDYLIGAEAGRARIKTMPEIVEKRTNVKTT